MSAANSDDKIVTIRTNFGMWGVGCYWTILEMIAAQMKVGKLQAKATFNVLELSSFFGCKRNKLDSFLECLQNVCEMKLTRSGNIVEIESDKLLKIKDNYLTDKEETSKKLPSIEVEEDVEVDKKKKENKEFESFWLAYPVKKGKGKAQQSWEKQKPILSEVITAIKAQQTERDEKLAAGLFTPEWKHPATWLNQLCWQDQVMTLEQIQHAAKSMPKDKLKKTELPNFESGTCGYCREYFGNLAAHFKSGCSKNPANGFIAGTQRSGVVKAIGEILK